MRESKKSKGGAFKASPPDRIGLKVIHLVYVTRIDDSYNLRSFGKVFSEILTLKKCQIGVFWAQPP